MSLCWRSRTKGKFKEPVQACREGTGQCGKCWTDLGLKKCLGPGKPSTHSEGPVPLPYSGKCPFNGRLRRMLAPPTARSSVSSHGCSIFPDATAGSPHLLRITPRGIYAAMKYGEGALLMNIACSLAYWRGAAFRTIVCRLITGCRGNRWKPGEGIRGFPK